MDKSWIHVTRGKFPRQARVGTVGKFNEELFGRQGFFGQASMLYHRESPAEIIRVEGDCQVRTANTLALATEDSTDPRGDFTALMANNDLVIAVSQRKAAMPFCYRNSIGDLLYFVHRGTGTFATEFGPLNYEPGDYVLLPKGTTFRLLPDDETSYFFVTQSRLPIRFTEHLQVGRHVPFDPAIIEIPELVDYNWTSQDEWELRVKHATGFTSVFYRNAPMDLVGWKGDLFPFRINIRDIIPLESLRSHLAPSALSTFDIDSGMIVTFIPQHAVADLGAEELPSHHRNIDCDEAIFIHSGKMFDPGTVIHQPQEIMHGANAAQRSEMNAARTPDMQRDLCGVSVDAFSPLEPTPAFRNLCGEAQPPKQ